MSDKAIASRLETPPVIDHIDKRMARPANEGKWKRRALSVAQGVRNTVVDTAHVLKESRLAQGAVAITMAAVLSRTPAGQEYTPKIVEGAEDMANAVIQPISELITGPHFENNLIALNDAKVIHREIAPKDGEQHFSHHMTVTSADSAKTRVEVYPLSSNTADGVLVLPIGTIPVGTEFDTMLMTKGSKYHVGVNDYSKPENDPANTGYTTTETYGAVDCRVVESVILDPSGNPMPDIAQNYPVCYIEGSNLKKDK